MLVLSRRIGEKLIIGDNIEFQILEITGNQVRIGIEAPKTINIVREEIAGKPRRDNSADPAQSAVLDIPVRQKQRVIGLRRRKGSNDLSGSSYRH